MFLKKHASILIKKVLVFILHMNLVSFLRFYVTFFEQQDMEIAQAETLAISWGF